MSDIYWINTMGHAEQVMVEHGRCPTLVQKCEWLMAGKDICNGKLIKLVNDSLDVYRCTQCHTKYEGIMRRKSHGHE